MVTKFTGGVSVNEFRDRRVKNVRVSKQRQVHLPKEYCEALGIVGEVQIENTGEELVIRPIKEREVVDFTRYILKDLQEGGYEGEALIEEFLNRKKQLPDALDALIADRMPEGKSHQGDLDSYLDMFEDED